MRSLTAFLLSFTLLTTIPLAAAQTSHDWQESTSQLRLGDHIRLSLRTGPVDGPFSSSTQQDITIGSTTTAKEEVLKIQRYRPDPGHHARRRARNAAIGAAIGFGAGFAVGKIGTNCTKPNEWLCGGDFSNYAGLIIGGGGLVVGGAVGALLPQRHAKETIYSFK